METENTPKVDLGSLGSFDFTPDWARKDAGITVGASRSSRDEESNDKKPVANAKKNFGDKKFSRDSRKPNFKDSRRPRFAERPKPLLADVKVLPDSKALGTIFRKIQNDSHAYKLKDLAYFFLENPAFVLLRINPKDGTEFYQCKACGFAALTQEDVVNHILSAHLKDYYDEKVVECEPPKGAFTCVAKCGLSGVLLGPPNVHAFNATVKEMLRTKYPNMSEAEYRSHIEMVRDEAAIEEWRASAVKKTIYVVKGAGEDPAILTREQAEAEFKRNVLSSMLDKPKQLMITVDVAMKSPVKQLNWLAKDALEAERRQPANMCFALRGAFHHRKLRFFRANDSRGPEFVSNVEYKEFDASHAIPELAKIATFIAENPCQPKSVIAKDPDSEKQLAWLVSTGHVVAFTNGVYSAVEKFPKYGPKWLKKADAGRDASPLASENADTGRDASPLASENADAGRDASPLASESEAQSENLKEESKNETAAELAE